MSQERGVFVQSVEHHHHKWRSNHRRGNGHKGKYRVRVKVTRRTRWDDLSGIGALERGMKVETIARRSGPTGTGTSGPAPGSH